MKDINELNYYLKSLEKDIIPNVIKVQRDTAEKIRTDAELIMSSHGTGEYAKTIKVGKTTIKGGEITTPVYTDCVVSAKKNGKSYNLGALLESGTDPHIIEPVDANALKFEIDGKTIFATRVFHPGSVAVPHFIPALNKNKTYYMEQMKKQIK